MRLVVVSSSSQIVGIVLTAALRIFNNFQKVRKQGFGCGQQCNLEVDDLYSCNCMLWSSLVRRLNHATA